MIRNYSRTKVFFNWLLEKLAFLILFPWIRAGRKNLTNCKRILLVEPFQMGDVLSLTPLIHPLLKKYPAAEIYILAKASAGSILEFDKRVHRVIKIDIPWSDQNKKRVSLKRLINSIRSTYRLRSLQFDLGLDTRGDVRSQILMVLAGCYSRVGYQNYLHSNINVSGILLTHKLRSSNYRHRYEWNLDLLTSLEIPTKELFPISFPTFYPSNLIAEKPGYFHQEPIVVHVGGGWIYRRWSESKWAKLIRDIRQRSERPIFVIGGEGEREILVWLNQEIGSLPNIYVKTTSLIEFVSLINSCKQYIGLDSGPMNLAACLNKNIIALFGPGDPTMWRPFNPNGKFVQKIDKFPCSPCLQIKCYFPEGNCMNEIHVDDVTKLFSRV